MKRISIIAILLFALIKVYSQEQIDLKQTFLEAEYYILYEDYEEALSLYRKLISNDHENAYIDFRMGECYLSIPGQKNKAISYLEKASEHISDKIKEGSFKETNAPIRTLFFLGKAYQINNQLDKAIDCFNQFKQALSADDIYNIDYVNQEIEACNNAKELMNHPLRFKETNAGNNVNDEFSNERPVVSSDGNSIVYISNLKFYDAIFYATKENGEWSTPINITPDLKSDGDFYPCYLSSDGTTLLLFKEDSYGGDIYVSYFKDGKWQLPSELNKNINSKYWETHATLTSDKKTMYFVSNRKDSYGGLDIYKSEFNEETGDWGVAKNLGPEINTPFNEESPCISEDGKTLYFSSQGHYNMGGYDIFFSKQLDSAKWSTPVNIGYPISTTDDNLFFYPIQDCKTAFFSKFDKDGFGQQDIYRIDFYTKDNPFLITVKGNVSLKDNQTDFFKEDFQVDIMDSLQQKTLKTIYLDENSGAFSTDLETGTYNFVFKSKNYKKKVKSLYIPYNCQKEKLIFNVELTPLKVITGEYLTIKNIYFGFDDYTLSIESKTELERIYNLMLKYPSLNLEIIGHTDSKGSLEYNMLLSKKRANSAIKYLTEKGIDPKRFVAKAAGMSQPIAINTNNDGTDNPDGRKFNRRIEIKVLKSDKNIVITEDVDLPANLKVKDLTYCIYLFSKIKELPEDYFNQFEQFNNYKIDIIKSSDSYIYTIGECDKKSELLKLFNSALELGFDDAEIMSSYDLKKLIK